MSARAELFSPKKTKAFQQDLAHLTSPDLVTLGDNQKNVMLENVGGGAAITVIGGIAASGIHTVAQAFSHNTADIVDGVLLSGIGLGLLATYYKLTVNAVTAHKNIKAVNQELKTRKGSKNSLA